METTQTSTKQRVQFDFTPEALRRLDDLKERVEASTRAEILRNALRLYEWFATQVDPDSIVEVQDKDGKTLFRIPAQILLS